jgi:hypothetical protein
MDLLCSPTAEERESNMIGSVRNLAASEQALLTKRVLE